MSTKKLFEIIPDDADIEIRGSLEVVITDVTIDSRQVQQGSLFVAVVGNTVDGHNYIGPAIEQGAVAVLCERLPSELVDAVTYIKVISVQKLAGQIIHAYFDYPSESFSLVGVTGTNGKTTITTLLHQLYTRMGVKVGLVSTVENRIGAEVIRSTHTTPDPVSLNRLLRQMSDAGCTCVFIEVSSHALDQGRVAGLDFDIAVFTNMSHDHLDYHGSFKEYVWAKKKLFDGLDRSSTAIINTDDKRGAVMVQNSDAKVVTYSLRTAADYRTRVIADTIEGLQLHMGRDELHCRMSGRYNAYNLTAVLATAEALGADREEVLPIISGLSGAEGRLERVAVQGSNKVAFVDYAHTPDALENVIDTLRATKTDSQSLLVVLGAGGDRDRTKRPVMAKIAVESADTVILTSDNPRTESPELILDDMEKGISEEYRGKYIRITDRAQAIKTAVLLAESNDIILVAGKGHEKYQDIDGVKHPFDDKEVLLSALILR